MAQPAPVVRLHALSLALTSVMNCIALNACPRLVGVACLTVAGNRLGRTDVGQSARYGVPSKSRSPTAPKNTSQPVTWFGGARAPCVAPLQAHGDALRPCV